jgi:hypothetical protein
VDIKYGSVRSGWCSKEIGGSFGVGVWKCIRRGWDAFAAHVRYEVGDGSLILFWHDVWCGDLPLIFQNCILLRVVRIHRWRRIWRDKMVIFCEIFCLLDLYMIGRWKWFPDLLRCCILLK